MISYIEWFVVNEYLRPDPQFEGSYNTDSFKWTDPRPYPSKEEIDKAIEEYWAMKAARKSMKKAEAKYKEDIEAGCTIDDVTYFCDDASLGNMHRIVSIPVIFGEDVETYLGGPIRFPTKSHGIITMGFEDFKRITYEIGKHVYNLKQNYWKSLEGLQS